MMNTPLPEPRLTKVFRLEARLGTPIDIGNVAQGKRRIIPLIDGTFSGPELNGEIIPGISADWQIVLSDGTALGDVRLALRTRTSSLIYMMSRGVRRGSADVLARISRGEVVDSSEYVFRTQVRFETTATDLDWLNKNVFIGVGGRQSANVIYEIYTVE
jgi:Protein of unknown function (DUF3237)